MTVKHKRVVTHTLADDNGNYSERFSCSWDEGGEWARFSSDEFQFTITLSGVGKLKELVDAFVAYHE